jgi:hypothetical protein
MKKLFYSVLLLVLATLLSAKSTQIKNFEELMEALKSGKDVKVVVDYGECRNITENEERPAPKAIGGMKVDVWEYFAPMAIGNPKAFVVFSQTKLINYAGYIYNYGKIKISDDNKVKITAQYTDAKTFEIEMDENFFTTVNDGKEGALKIFAE